MANTYLLPGNFDIQDVSIPSGGRPARLIFPSSSTSIYDEEVLPGTYPLVVFLHGDRRNTDYSFLCPQDITEDYRAWGPVLYLLAQCGFVVAVPDVHNSTAEDAANTIDRIVRWMHYEWAHREVLWYDAFALSDEHVSTYGATVETQAIHPEAEGAIGLASVEDNPIRPGGLRTPVGVAGHSWGTRGCAIYAARPSSSVAAVASIAGIIDDNESTDALIAAQSPKLMVGGTADITGTDLLRAFWSQLAPPVHQAVVQGADHFDWFGSHGYIHHCDGTPSGTCPLGGAIAAELLLTFMTKYLKNYWYLPRSLIGPSGARQPLVGRFAEFAGCGLAVRWKAPVFPGGPARTGETRHGNLPDFHGWDQI